MRYRVKALQPGTGVTALVIEALDAGEAAARVRQQGGQVLHVVPERSGWQSARRTRFPLLLFTQ